MSITHRASVASENFEYEGFGDSEQKARAVLLAGLQAHRKELDLEAGWPTEVAADAVITAIADGTILFTTFDDKATVHVIEPGIRDGSQVAYRSYAEMKCPVRGWGYVEAYAADEDTTRAAVIRGINAIDSSQRLPETDEDIEGDPIRESGAYRGGMVQSRGEAILDDAIVPTLPPHSKDWLPTVRVTLSLYGPDGLIESGEAVSRPSRLNRRSVIDFVTDEVGPILDDIRKHLTNAEHRRRMDDIIRDPDHDLVGLLFSKELGEVEVSRDYDGLRLSLRAQITPTRAEDLVLES